MDTRTTMRRYTSTPPPFVIFAILGGLLFILGGVLTTMSASARWSLLGTALAFAGLGVYTLHVLRIANQRRDDIERLNADVDRLVVADASLRNRMVSTMSDPLTGIINLVDSMISEPTMETPDRVVILEQIRDSAREVDGVLADLATWSNDASVAEPVGAVVSLDREARSVIASAHKNAPYSSDLQPAHAVADSAKVRQIIRTILNAAETAHCEQVTVKTGERSSQAMITISAHGHLLPIEGIAALTGNAEAGDADRATYIALRDANTMAAEMGGTIGYTEVFGMSHVVLELDRAPVDSEAEGAETARREQPSITELGFTAAVDLRPERPTASIRFS